MAIGTVAFGVVIGWLLVPWISFAWRNVIFLSSCVIILAATAILLSLQSTILVLSVIVGAYLHLMFHQWIKVYVK